MEGFTTVSLLLLSTLLLWEWQLAQPTLDNILTHIKPSSTYTEIYIPVSEVVALCVALFVILSGYYLYWVSANSRLSLKENILFLGCAYMLASGSGLHVGCVITELNILDGDMSVDSLSALLHIMHEYWSHNTTLFGFFIMMLLIIWKEIGYVSNTNTQTSDSNSSSQAMSHQDHSDSKGQVAESAYSSVHNRKGLNNRNASNNSTQPHSNNKDCEKLPKKGYSSSVGCLSWVLFIQWVLPLQAGLFISVFSTKTSTETITLIFYFSSIVLFLIGRQKFTTSSFWLYLKMCNSQLIVLSTFVKAAFIGSLTLGYLLMYGISTA